MTKAGENGSTCLFSLPRRPTSAATVQEGGVSVSSGSDAQFIIPPAPPPDAWIAALPSPAHHSPHPAAKIRQRISDLHVLFPCRPESRPPAAEERPAISGKASRFPKGQKGTEAPPRSCLPGGEKSALLMEGVQNARIEAYGPVGRSFKSGEARPDPASPFIPPRSPPA